MFGDILKAAKEGWHGAGIEWREVAIHHNINPDRFLELPGGAEMMARAMQLPKEKQAVFLNTIARKYSFLRYQEENKIVGDY